MTKMSARPKLFVQSKIKNPLLPQADHVIAAGYHPKNRKVARSIGSQLMARKDVQRGLAKYDRLLEGAIIGTVKDWKDHYKPRQREIAMQNAQYMYDHIHGKATVKVEQHSTVVKVAIDLTGTPVPVDPTTVID